MIAITPELLNRFDVSGPRYTSYPTADRFVEAFGEAEYVLALQGRRSLATAQPLSPFAPDNPLAPSTLLDVHQ